MRILLLHVPGPTSFEFLRTVDNITYQTYQEACLKRGLTTDDKEWERALNDAKLSSMPRNMRLLYVNILINCNPVKPYDLWEMFKDALSEDYLYVLKVSEIEDQELKQKTEELAFQKAYADIANLYLTEKGMAITFITGMPEPNMDLNDLVMNIDTVKHKNIAETMFASMNEKQKEFFTLVQEASNEESPQKTCFYLEGAAGTGKTYCYLAIYHDLMSRGKLVKNMASTAMAADLLPSGRTVHFTAGVRPPIDNRSITKFSKNTMQGKELIAAKLFIWDEAPMADRYLLETFDRSLKELCNNNKPFGGKLIILGGDFRQCAPVVKEGTKAQIIGQSIKKCDLWKHFRPSFKLTENQRVDPEEIEFLEALRKLGDGELQDKDEGEFEFPEECISDNVLDDVYGTALATKNYESLHERVILTPYNKDANLICEQVLDFIEGQEKVYTSVDTLAKDNNLTNTENYPTEILNSIEMNSMPNHELCLKINAIIMLIRNLNASQGHNNGTRIIVTELKDNIIEGKILTGDRKGDTIFIPRITFVSDDPKLSFKFHRHQFPVKLAFAMTINKSQGQTFRFVGLNLMNDVFSHGQLYVAASRVRKMSDLKIQLKPDRENNSVKNVVFKELLED